jgi:hypothetical protein
VAVAVHLRSPRRLVARVGIVDALSFLLLVAGTPLTFLLAPVMWAGTAAWYGFGEPHLPLLDSGTFWLVAMINLIVGNGIMIALNLIAAVRDPGVALGAVRATQSALLGAPLGRRVARARAADPQPVLLGEDAPRAGPARRHRAGSFPSRRLSSRATGASVDHALLPA